ncbi:Sperm associated antigen 1 [Dinochytrium kinnereticum]|nr:Sperm associated antigen 1 [Dinochytrium kinnereticum]
MADLDSLSLLSKTAFARETEDTQFEYDISELDYSFVKDCKDSGHLKRLLRVLRTGREGYYPALEKAFEEKIALLDGSSYSVRAENRATLEQVSSLKAEVGDWEKSINESDERLKSGKTSQRTLFSRPSVRFSQNDPDLDTADVEGEDISASNEIIGSVWKDDHSSSNVQEEESMYLAEIERIKGNECLKAGEIQEAIEFYTQSLKLCRRPKLYTNRALAYIKLGKFSFAEEDASSALEFEDQQYHFKAYLRRGMARYQMKQYNQAEHDLKEALRLHPVDETAKTYMKKVQEALAKKAAITTKFGKITSNATDIEAGSSIAPRRLTVIDVDTDDDE